MRHFPILTTIAGIATIVGAAATVALLIVALVERWGR
jgi:hypothetical protein